MTDAKEPEVIEYLRQEARDGSVFLYNVRGGVACAISVILDEFETLTRERDAVMQHAARQLELRYAANRELVALQREIALRAANQDADRLDWMADIIAIEAFGTAGRRWRDCAGTEIYEHASQVADERGNEGDPTDSDMRKGFRRMIDAARTADAERRA